MGTAALGGAGSGALPKSPVGGTASTAGQTGGLAGASPQNPGAGTSAAMGGAGAAGTGGAAGASNDGADAGSNAAGMGDGAGSGGEPPPVDAGAMDEEPSCDLRCDPGSYCELVEVTCVRAPCPPMPQCVKSPTCGGFAGLPCVGMGECVDDPSDDCDPDNGGADCGGVCTCPAEATCSDGQHWDASPAVCGCVDDDGGSAQSGGEVCGNTVCEDGTVCCNASCSMCAPPDVACIQIACD